MKSSLAARLAALAVTLVSVGAAVPSVAATPRAATPGEQSRDKIRLIVLSDIGNEPDDSQSLVRLLLYANQFDIEGLVATTSASLPKAQPALIEERLEAYGKVLPNLEQHASGYPSVKHLQAVLRSGVAAYGMEGVGAGKDTDASRLIIAAVDQSDKRPVWVTIWGGAADLAQALWTVRATRGPDQVNAFLAKLRVYSISDQDTAGPWIRRTFPELFWIASVHGFGQFGTATWPGISGDLLFPTKWPDHEMVTDDWLTANIRKGPLGDLYPKSLYIMEGDSPSFLYLINNGLNVPEHPEFGGWGGRYTKSDPTAGHYGDASDLFIDQTGAIWFENKATIYRWRGAFQRDFAARIQWSLTPSFKLANHSPVVRLNGQGGQAPISLSARPGQTVTLDAAGTSDPDDNALAYQWTYYSEAAGEPPEDRSIAPLQLQGDTTSRTSFTLPETKTPTTVHVILAVTDNGAPALTSYRRAVITVQP